MGWLPYGGTVTPFGWLRWLRRLLSLGVIIAVFGGLAVGFDVWWTGEEDQRQHADVILVMGASQFDGRPSAVLAARLDHAQTLFDAKLAPVIVTVGGSRPGDRFTEGGSGKVYLEKRGVPAADLIGVGEGGDTLLSLRAAATVLNAHRWHSILLVTDPWHSLRARTMAQDLGFIVHTSPVPGGPSRHGLLTQARYIVRESVAYVYYRVFHRASRAGPSAV